MSLFLKQYAIVSIGLYVVLFLILGGNNVLREGKSRLGGCSYPSP